jgi:hypothetical protein
MGVKQTENKYSSRSLIDKLGVKHDAAVALVGLTDETFIEQLRERTRDIVPFRLKKNLDFIFLSAESLHDLRQLERLRGYLKSTGAIWVVSTKGKPARIKDLDVIAAAKRARLVDNKVVSFSDTYTALKLVIPVALRTGST